MNHQMMKYEEVAGKKPSILSDLSVAKRVDQQHMGNFEGEVELVWLVLQSPNLLQMGKIAKHYHAPKAGVSTKLPHRGLQLPKALACKWTSLLITVKDLLKVTQIKQTNDALVNMTIIWAGLARCNIFKIQPVALKWQWPAREPLHLIDNYCLYIQGQHLNGKWQLRFRRRLCGRDGS